MNSPDDSYLSTDSSSSGHLFNRDANSLSPHPNIFCISIDGLGIVGVFDIQVQVIGCHGLLVGFILLVSCGPG